MLYVSIPKQACALNSCCFSSSSQSHFDPMKLESSRDSFLYRPKNEKQKTKPNNETNLDKLNTHCFTEHR